MDDLEVLLCIQALQADEEDDEEDEHGGRSRAAFALTIAMALQSKQLRAHRRSQTRLYLVRANLLPNPRIGTPWQRLCASKSDRAYITTMGFDVATFKAILRAGFAVHWYSTPIKRRDVNSGGKARPVTRSLDAAGGLGLILHYLCSTSHEVALQEIFALVPATLSRYITFGLKILLATLRRMPDASIAWPRGHDFQQFNDIIRTRHPRLTGAFASIDGLNLPVQTSGNEDIENASYNGWLHSHFVSSVLVFAPTGAIIGAHLNAPGSWHDSRVAQPIYRRLQTQTPDGFYLVADTAFPRGTLSVEGRIKAPLKAGQSIHGTASEIAEVIQFNRELLSYRQTAEWGNRGLQGSFGRLRVPLDVTSRKRRGDILETCIRAFTLRTRRIGINQINSVYLGEGDQTERRIWANFENILFADQRRHDRVLRFHIDVDYY